MEGLPPESEIYLTTRNNWGYLDELYDGLPCVDGAPAGCDPTKGTPVVLSPGTALRHLDFDLLLLDNGIVGTVVDEATGAPLAGVYIDAWNAAGEHVETTLTELSGSFVLALSPGTYYLSTDNGAGLTDEVWENLLCPTGSAYVGGCDPTQGDPITVGDPGPAVASGIAFSLGRDLFEDGFESGDTAAWTAVVP